VVVRPVTAALLHGIAVGIRKARRRWARWSGAPG